MCMYVNMYDFQLLWEKVWGEEGVVNTTGFSLGYTE